MKAEEIADKAICEIEKGTDFMFINFANADMVGHTANKEAIIQGLEKVDQELKRVVTAILAHNGLAIVTADHGNAEINIDLKTGDQHTAHTVNPVPFIIADFYNKFPNISIKSGGRLSDVAVSILDLLEIDKPGDMTGESLIIHSKLKDFYKVQKIEALEAFDSRGKSTIKARIILDDGSVGEYALVPAGKSTGKGEAPVVSTEVALKNILDIEKVFNNLTYIN
jgi:hypothetical protein